MAMRSNYYPDDEEASDSPAAPPPEENPESDAMEGETFLVNKSALGDPEVGEECTIRIVAMHEDEAECEYVKPSKEESKAPEKGFPETIGDRLRGGPGAMAMG